MNSRVRVQGFGVFFFGTSDVISGSDSGLGNSACNLTAASRSVGFRGKPSGMNNVDVESVASRTRMGRFSPSIVRRSTPIHNPS